MNKRFFKINALLLAATHLHATNHGNLPWKEARKYIEFLNSPNQREHIRQDAEFLLSDMSVTGTELDKIFLTLINEITFLME